MFHDVPIIHVPGKTMNNTFTAKWVSGSLFTAMYSMFFLNLYTQTTFAEMKG